MHVQLLLTTSGDTLLTILWNTLYQNKKKSNPLQPLQYQIFKVIYIASLYLKKKTQMKLQKPAAIYYINEDF